MRPPLVPLCDLVERISRSVKVDPATEYRLLGMRSRTGGPFLRESKPGSKISTGTLYRVEAGDFIYSRLFAWQGSFGIIPRSLHGCHVSNEFPTFHVKEDRLSSRYLVSWFGLPKTRELVEADCFGSTPGTRNRYKEEYLLRLHVPLPALHQQLRVVAKLDRISSQRKRHANHVQTVDQDVKTMLSNAFRRVVDAAPRRPVVEVAPLFRRPVDVHPDHSYPELGVRSFGRGTFHKPTIDGNTVGSKRLFSVREGDLLFNIVFAWEGAVAVARTEDHGRVGSHRFLTCVPDERVTTSSFLHFYFLTPEGLHQLGEASPGGAGRNRTLGLKKLDAIRVPIPNIDRQRWFDRLQALVWEMDVQRTAASREINALSSAVLHAAFTSDVYR